MRQETPTGGSQLPKLIFRRDPLSASRNFFAISLIVLVLVLVINLCSFTVSAADQNTSAALESWLDDSDDDDGEDDFSGIIENCLDFCSNEDKHYESLLTLGCDSYKDLCSRGCSKWKHSTSSTCLHVCHDDTWQSSLSPCDLACISGCNRAITNVMDQFRESPDLNTSPELINDTLNGTSLTLSWPIEKKKIATERLVLQYKREHVSPKWRYLSNLKWFDNYTCTVEKLLPYTKYRFRVALMVTTDPLDFVFSEQSAVIQTMPMGAPTSAPEITETIALDYSKVAVFWRQGRDINAPLEGYTIRAFSSESEDAAPVYETTVNETEDYAVLPGLRSHTTYRIEVSMSNGFGEGPAAVTTVTTPNRPQEIANPEFIVVGEYEVTLLNMTTDGSNTKKLYKSDHAIVGFDVSLEEQALFVSDESGYLYRINMRNEDERHVVLSPKSSALNGPTKLTLDWLNSNLYMLDEVEDKDQAKSWRIATTGFRGNDLKFILDGLTEEPLQLRVDPLNGFLFWITSESGIYRLDLADGSWQQIHKTVTDLVAFTIDPERHLITAYSREWRKFVTVTFDGRFAFDVDVEVLSESVKDMVVMEAHLYWTDGNNICSNQSLTALFDSSKILKSAKMSSQPKPHPTTAPIELQALLTADNARLEWKPPRRGYFQGAAGWDSWSYDLEISEGEVSNAIKNIKTEFFSVEKLKPDTEYWFRVRTTNGRASDGPWSEWLQAKTWPEAEERHLFWASDSGLLRSNEVAGDLEILLNGSISSLSWANGTVYLVKDSLLSKWDMANLTTFLDDASCDAVDYDWKGRKLYFTDKENRVVSRVNLDGTGRELLPIAGVKRMLVDSENGYLYFSTGLRIEACRLNGRQCMTYYRTSLFSEEDLIGPTLDWERGRVFWVTQSDQDGFLFSSDMAHNPKSPDSLVMTPLDGFPAIDWFACTPSGLIWSTNTTALVFTDTNGENKAFLNLQAPVSSVRVVEPARESDASLSVSPHAVDTSSVKVEGLWDNFNITWRAVATEDDYAVSYFLKIGDDIFLESSEPSVRYPRSDLPAYSPLRVWITSSSAWSRGPTVTADIFSPTAAPSEPQRLRAFITRRHDPLQEGQTISAIVRWEPPADPNGPIVLYSILCRKEDDVVAAQNSTDLEATFWDLQENTTFAFQAQAFTSGAAGNTSEEVQVTVNSSFQSIPRVIVATDSYVGILDMELNSTEIMAQTSGPARHVASIREENVVLWMNPRGELLMHHEGNVSIVASLESEVEGLAVDWVSRRVYYSLADAGGGSTIHFLDLNQFEGEAIRSQLLISNPKPIKDLVMFPASQTLVWLELDGSLSGWNLKDLSEINLLLGTDLRFERLYPGSFEENLESVILVDGSEGICLMDLRTEKCQFLKIGTDSEPNLHLTWDNGYFYALKNHSIRAYNRRKLSLEYMVDIDGVSEIVALGLQPYPEKKCLLPDFAEEPLEDRTLLVSQLVNSTENSLELQFPRVSSPPECGRTIPGLRYVLSLKETDKDDPPARQMHSFEPHMNVTALKPFTRYTLQLEVSNYYSDKMGLAKIEGPGVDFRTAPGTPYLPRNISVSAVSPRDGLVEWTVPEVLNNDRVWYEIHWETENPTNGVVHRHQNFEPETDEPSNTFLLSGLRPDHKYWVWLKVFSTQTAYNTSATHWFDTFPEPSGLTFVNSSAYNLTLSWDPSANVTSTFLLYSPVDVDDPISVNITNDSHNKIVESLEPKTKYVFRLKLFYSHSLHSYVWPLDNRFVFETLGDRPTAPGQPFIEHIKGEVYKVFWEAARNNGAPVEEYSLEALQSSQMRRVRRSHYYPQDDNKRVSNKTLARLGQLPWAEEIEPIQDKWIPYCNGTETNCIIKELHTMRLLMFRVRARNAYGWGPYSIDSEIVAEPLVLPRKRDTLVFAIIAPITIVSTCVTMAVLVRYIHSRRKQAKKLLYETRPSIWGLDGATLQQVARSRNFSQTSSMLYTGKPLTDGDIALLPQISRTQISMQSFLGSGAFGEVYEGLVTYTDDGSQDRVAIKTLRKCASDREKTELLQEAHLMSHFKHENIVKLIGVCFDVDSICIIMELMEGGDLQTYLRHARPNLSKMGTLSLLDLVNMCLDVCTGCRYLEDLHFLHRDLACRNCLVSSLDPEHRVVKIGDFGLARDIYKSDYYRKEGEGLLPVRWMAPECLVDGVFTSQSDIWSFGILLWEILSLGQQPYPAQSNLEVLNFVKEGGRLQQPQDCPDKLYKLMMQCWCHEPKDRPTFQQCLDELLSMKLETLNEGYSKDYEGGGIRNLSYAASDDEESIAKASSGSEDDHPSTLNADFADQVSINQRAQDEDHMSRELTSFRAPAPATVDAVIDGNQAKRKSVHYVNEGLSRL